MKSVEKFTVTLFGVFAALIVLPALVLVVASVLLPGALSLD